MAKVGIFNEGESSMPSPKVIVKPLPSSLKYVYLDVDKRSLVIVSFEL